VAVAEAGRHIGECRFLRPVAVLHRLLRTWTMELELVGCFP
jgi:U6 snRNA-associated Sm-like protein LSm4